MKQMTSVAQTAGAYHNCPRPAYIPGSSLVGFSQHRSLRRVLKPARKVAAIHTLDDVVEKLIALGNSISALRADADTKFGSLEAKFGSLEAKFGSLEAKTEQAFGRQNELLGYLVENVIRQIVNNQAMPSPCRGFTIASMDDLIGHTGLPVNDDSRRKLCAALVFKDCGLRCALVALMEEWKQDPSMVSQLFHQQQWDALRAAFGKAGKPKKGPRANAVHSFLKLKAAHLDTAALIDKLQKDQVMFMTFATARATGIAQEKLEVDVFDQPGLQLNATSGTASASFGEIKSSSAMIPEAREQVRTTASLLAWACHVLKDVATFNADAKIYVFMDGSKPQKGQMQPNEDLTVPAGEGIADVDSSAPASFALPPTPTPPTNANSTSSCFSATTNLTNPPPTSVVEPPPHARVRVHITYTYFVARSGNLLRWCEQSEEDPMESDPAALQARRLMRTAMLAFIAIVASILKNQQRPCPSN